MCLCVGGSESGGCAGFKDVVLGWRYISIRYHVVGRDTVVGV